jgi:hypothetical protein
MSIRRFHRSKRKGTSSREFNLSLHDLPKQIDVLFAGCDGDHLGEVVAKASPAGRRAGEKLFPNAYIAWREVDGPDKSHFPDDWREFCFVIPWLLANAPDHGLRRDLLALRQLDELSPDQFPFLMMASTNEQGARAAFWSTDNRLVQVSMPSQCN